MNEPRTEKIEIRPESNVYGTYRRLAYKVWFALSEFVDNSTQNFFEHRHEIEVVDGVLSTLTVEIMYDSQTDTLSISDDANGMNFEELTRAVQLNRPPADRSGRSEFGMGLKMAACWLGSQWRVVTKRLGSEEEYQVSVDISDLEAHKPEAVSVLVRSGLDTSQHYTRIEIEGLYRKFRGQSITRLKEHLSSIYRRDIESEQVVIKWNGERLTWESDPVFEETLPDGRKQRWEKSVHFEVSGLPVKGRIWIRLPGSARRAGLHLFRRGRIIVGGPGAGYKPSEIFGALNLYSPQRLVGELDMDDWPVTQTKDAFDWAGDLEYEFLAKLQEFTSDYREKAESIRVLEGDKPTKADAQLAADAIKDALADPALDTALTIIETGPPPIIKPVGEEIALITEITKDEGEPTRVTVGSEGLPELEVWFLDGRPESEIYVQFACPNENTLQLTVNLNHPFATNVLQRNPEKLKLWAQTLYVDALVERAARMRGNNLPPSGYREYKDIFLRRIRRT